MLWQWVMQNQKDILYTLGGLILAALCAWIWMAKTAKYPSEDLSIHD